MRTPEAEWAGGMGTGLGGLARLSSAQTRSLSAENPTGEKGRGGAASEGTGAGAARELGRGWKISPSIVIEPGRTAVLADIGGPGVIQHIWCTVQPQHWRTLVPRFSWDAADRAAVEVPIGDFFCQGWCEFSQVSSLPVAANAHGGFNSYWPMPFRRNAQITIDNLGANPPFSTIRLPTRFWTFPTTRGICTRSGGGATPCRTATCIWCSTARQDLVITWGPTWPGA